MDHVSTVTDLDAQEIFYDYQIQHKTTSWNEFAVTCTSDWTYFQRGSTSVPSVKFLNLFPVYVERLNAQRKVYFIKKIFSIAKVDFAYFIIVQLSAVFWSSIIKMFTNGNQSGASSE